MSSAVTSGMFALSRASGESIVVLSLFTTKFYKITFRAQVKTSFSNLNILNMLPLIHLIFLVLLTVKCFPVEQNW